MKQDWPQKVSKIVAELLQTNQRISIIDNITCGKLTSILGSMDNYTNYMAGNIIMTATSSMNILDIPSTLTSYNIRNLESLLQNLFKQGVSWFGRDICHINVLNYEYNTENATCTVLIDIRTRQGVCQQQKNMFSIDGLSQDQIRDVIIDYVLELLVEVLIKCPHLKCIDYE